MVQTVTSGYSSYANYGFEATYGAGAVSARTFGRDVKITVNRKNSIERNFGIGARNATTAVALKYEADASIDFIMANGSFWRAVLGAVADAGGGPYTHTYTESDVIPSFAIDTGINLGTNDFVSELQGCKVQSMTLTAAVGEMVKVRIECPYKTEIFAQTGIGSQTSEIEEPFTFAHGDVQLPNATSILNVQSIELTVTNDIEMLWGIGDRVASQAIERKREYNFKMTVALSDPDALFTKFLGASGAPIAGTPVADATIELTFTNGLAGVNERSMIILLANAYLNDYTLPMDINEIIKEDVTGFALSGTSVIYTNNTIVDEGNP